KGIIPGEFLIPANTNLFGVVNYITNPRNIYYYKITLVEGQTIAQFLQLIASNPNLTGDIFKVEEGTMMPDTYYFSRGSTRAELITRATEAMDKYLADLWENRNTDLPFKNKKEALVLASMVEKETGVARERDLIAGLFINRLRYGYKLQSDPTVAYGLGKASADKLTKKDLTTVHPYNTYTMYGLPIAPIANPSRESLRAVFFPADTKYLYFVADGSGGHIFTINLKDHNIEVAKWREIERGIRQRESKAN
ncbi:MAG: endolytic transglycosylase MltG, partial [Alphaproteobacteria bacterium]|nr:endolytic transglycosylase MltG [Alphaproteobacteria bacterium]